MSRSAWRSASSSVVVVSCGVIGHLAARPPTVQVDNGDVGAADHQSLAHDQTEASSTSCDEANVALERKGGKGTLEMVAAATLHRLTLGHVLLLGMLHRDLLVGTREGPDVVTDLALVGLIFTLTGGRRKGSEGREACCAGCGGS